MADKSICSTTNEVGQNISTEDDTEIERRHPRKDLGGTAAATIYPLDGGSEKPFQCPVLMRNVSTAGFGIALTTKVQPKQRIELDVQGKRQQCEIVWCHSAQSGFYIAGCKLLSSSAAG